MTDQQDICAKFVRENAVSADESESYVHLGIDIEYHPTGGYWFPTGETWDDSSGCVSSKNDIPGGELIQYPCDDREPEIRGSGELPDWVVNRTLSADVSDQDGGRDE